MIHPVRLLLLCCFLGAVVRSDADTPVIFRVSDPILPGQTALLFGGALSERAEVTGMRLDDDAVAAPPASLVDNVQVQGEKLSVLQASDVSVKAALPAGWRQGEYALKLSVPGGAALTVYLNRTEPWWWLGDGDGGAALSGHIIQVFGKNFSAQMRGWLVGGGQNRELKTERADKYAAAFRIPEDTPPGDYQLWLHNGYGGQYGFGKPLAVSVSRQNPWPENEFNVRSLGAHGDGIADDTGAFKSALAKAQQNGGGVVFIPAGHYRIAETLTIPARTVLRGASRETVWLFVPKEVPEFGAVIVGDGEFGVEALSLVAQTARALIACPEAPSIQARLGSMTPRGGGHDVHLAHLRLQLLRYRHVTVNDTRRQEQVGPSAIVLRGPGMRLEDLNVASAGMPLEMHDAHRCLVERCTLRTGRNGWYGIWGFIESDFENNDIESGDLEGTGGGVQTDAYRLYFANNRWHDIYGNDREALSFDSPYYAAWIGHTDSANQTGFTASGQTWQPDALKGKVCVVAGGRGLGQCVIIAGNTANTVTLEAPWSIQPDATSLLVVQTNKTEVVVTNNHFTDASVAVQLYTQTYGFIVDGNESERTGGSYSMSWDFGGAAGRRFSTSYFNQWIDNRFSEGFVYQQGPSAHGIIGPFVDMTLLDRPMTPEHGITVVGNVIRGNIAKNQVTVGVLYDTRRFSNIRLNGPYLGRDNIIEDNTVSDAEVGVEVDPNFVGTLVRHNHITDCVVPVQDHGTDTLIDERH